MRRPSALLALVVPMALAAGPARGADEANLSLAITPSSIVWGDTADLGGRLLVDNQPRADVPVGIAAAALPGGTRFAPSTEPGRTQADGTYGFTAAPNRSFRFRTGTADPPALSAIRTLYVVPRKTLTARTDRRRRHAHITVTALVPRGARLQHSRIYFYVASLTARRIAFAGRAWVRAAGQTRLLRTATRADRFRASLGVTLRRSWHGSYSYGFCYDAPRATGLDDPRSRCSRRALVNPARRSAYRAQAASAAGESGASSKP